MAEIVTLEVRSRERVGKGGARAARRAGRLPGIVYGGDNDPRPISLAPRDLARELRNPGFFSQLMNLKLDDETQSVLPRDVQFHPVTDAPLHVDFMRVAADSEITLSVPVSFVNEEDCPGLRAGGVINMVRHDIEVRCRADAIPESLKIDLGEAEIGDSIHIAAIDLPEGVAPTITDRDFTVVTIAAPSGLVSEHAEDEEEGEEGEEALEAETEGEAEG